MSSAGGAGAVLARQVTELVAKVPDETLTRVLEVLAYPAARRSVISAAFSKQSTRDAFDALWHTAERDFGAAAPRVVAALLWTARETAARTQKPTVEVVWTGPAVGAEAIYRTEQTLLGLLRQARASVIIVTYVTHQRHRDDLRVRAVQARARRGGDQWRAHGRSRTRPRHAGACAQRGLQASAPASGRVRVASTVARSTPGG